MPNVWTDVTLAQADSPTLRKPLRLWPGIVVVVAQWLLFAVVPIVDPGDAVVGLLTGIGSALLVILWWLFLSRAQWLDRLGALVLMTIAIIVNARFVDNSFAAMAYFLPIPVYCLALVIWAAATRRMPDGGRRVWLVIAAILACVPANLVRIDGATGDLRIQLAWRWSATAEERLLAQTGGKLLAPAVAETPRPAPGATSTEKAAAPAVTTKAPDKKLPASPSEKAATAPALAVVKSAAIWPGFRGPNRDGVVPGAKIKTDWAATPPVQLWRRAIGPGWSSFAVDGDLLYTQEQRGEGELVSCYKVSTGEPVWQHRDAARFWEAAGGAGPRATPTLSNGRVYTLGATGIVNALDAATGAVVWTRNAATDTGAKIPQWGFAGSPLVVDDEVIIAASGRLVAYDVATGTLRWTAQTGGGGYSSPQLMAIGGIAQVLLASGAGISSFAPADGKQLWAAALSGFRIIQPGLTVDGDVLMTVGDEGGLGESGLRRIAVAQGSGGWTVQERWTSRGMKPKFNDFVVYKGHAYGFDGSILSCIDLADGARKWKGGRYGTGQLVLLPDQDLLLVLSEEGELALVPATTDKFTELARFPAIEGKTWNHPVLVGDVLLVRNDREMAAFRLSLARP